MSPMWTYLLIRWITSKSKSSQCLNLRLPASSTMSCIKKSNLRIRYYFVFLFRILSLNTTVRMVESMMNPWLNSRISDKQCELQPGKFSQSINSLKTEKNMCVKRIIFDLFYSKLLKFFPPINVYLYCRTRQNVNTN